MRTYGVDFGSYLQSTYLGTAAVLGRARTPPGSSLYTVTGDVSNTDGRQAAHRHPVAGVSACVSIINITHTHLSEKQGKRTRAVVGLLIDRAARDTDTNLTVLCAAFVGCAIVRLPRALLNIHSGSLLLTAQSSARQHVSTSARQHRRGHARTASSALPLVRFLLDQFRRELTELTHNAPPLSRRAGLPSSSQRKVSFWRPLLQPIHT